MEIQRGEHLRPTNSSYTIANVQSANAGSYTVTVTNSAGSVTSSAATLTVVGGTTTTIQAESGLVGGGATIDSNNAGFTGTGFANFPATGGFLQFSSVAGGAVAVPRSWFVSPTAAGPRARAAS